jgi:putative transposase
MPTSRVDVFIHLIWATWDRQPILTDELAPRVQHVVAKKAQECGAEVLAIGGAADHLHLLVRLPPTMAVAELAKQLKGSSAYFVAHRIAPGSGFKWQGSYGAFSIGRRQLPHVCDYIARQREHHDANAAIVRWEEHVLTRTRAIGEGEEDGWDDTWEESSGEETEGGDATG